MLWRRVCLCRMHFHTWRSEGPLFWVYAIGNGSQLLVGAAISFQAFNTYFIHCTYPLHPSHYFLAHHFAKLLHSKTGKLKRVYTQNIDGLANAVGLPDEKVVSVHGNISKTSCETCGKEMDFNAFCDQVETKIRDIYNPQNGPVKSESICCEGCGKATVKPKTVLFGSSLPEEFFTRSEEDLPGTDLLIVAGTSLVVSPANTLVYRVPKDAQRVVVNNEPVGQQLGIDYGSNAERDYFAQGYCDEVFLDLICDLGWLEDLNEVADNLPASSVKLILAKEKE